MCSIYSGFHELEECSEPIYTCACCDEGICEGEEYYRVGNSCFHWECLKDNYCNVELLELFGATPRLATREAIRVSVVGVFNGK